MKKKRSAAFKFKVAITAVKGDQTTAEICDKYEVASSLVNKWKKALLEQGANVFDKQGQKQKNKEQQTETSQLYEKIGKLTIERDFLKKSWENYQ